VGPARLRRPRGLDGVEGIGLAALAPTLAVLAVYFDDMDPCSGEETGHAGSIGPRLLHPNLGDLAEGFEPGQKIRIAAGIGPERLRAEQATNLI
jgi:hypothetical protein